MYTPNSHNSDPAGEPAKLDSSLPRGDEEDRRRWACVIHSLNGGGAERVLARLVGELSDRGHQVHLITLDDGSQDRYPVAPAVHRHCLDLMGESTGWISGIRNTRRRVSRLRSKLRAIDPDAVLSFCDRNNILTLLSAGSIPTVVSERSDPARQSLGRFWNWMRNRTYRRADRVVAQTAAAAKFLEHQTGRDVDVIASAVDPSQATVDFDARWAKRTILGVGRFEREKGFDRLITAFAKIAADVPEWRLRLVGDGSMRSEWEQLRQSTGVAQRITLDPWQSRIDEAYRTASLFALSSRYEGFPAALLEAMAAGIPVVAVRCPSGPEAIIRSIDWSLVTEDWAASDPERATGDGVLVDNDVDSLAAGMRRMIENPDLARELSTRAREVTDRFGWPAMVTAYENTLIQAARRKCI